MFVSVLQFIVCFLLFFFAVLACPLLPYSRSLSLSLSRCFLFFFLSFVCLLLSLATCALTCFSTNCFSKPLLNSSERVINLLHLIRIGFFARRVMDPPLSMPCITPKLSVVIVSGRGACSDVFLKALISHIFLDFVDIPTLLALYRTPHACVLLRDRHKNPLSHIQWPPMILVLAQRLPIQRQYFSPLISWQLNPFLCASNSYSLWYSFPSAPHFKHLSILNQSISCCRFCVLVR